MMTIDKRNPESIETLEINEIMRTLPHRYPFLLIDRVSDYKIGEYLIAVKNVSYNEPCFTGHFPHRPIFPGVLILEAMAQATGVLSFKTMGKEPNQNSLYFFAGVDKARFKKPVVPGDQLIVEVILKKMRQRTVKYDAIARVDGDVVCSAEVMCVEKEIED